jgi:hypothetical protein
LLANVQLSSRLVSGYVEAVLTVHTSLFHQNLLRLGEALQRHWKWEGHSSRTLPTVSGLEALVLYAEVISGRRPGVFLGSDWVITMRQQIIGRIDSASNSVEHITGVRSDVSLLVGQVQRLECSLVI